MSNTFVNSYMTRKLNVVVRAFNRSSYSVFTNSNFLFFSVGIVKLFQKIGFDRFQWVLVSPHGCWIVTEPCFDFIKFFHEINEVVRKSSTDVFHGYLHRKHDETLQIPSIGFMFKRVARIGSILIH